MRANWSRRLSTVVVVGTVFGAVSGVFAGPVIVVGPGGAVGNYELLENTPGQWIEIIVSGGDAVEGCNFNAQIGDGGPEAGGTPGPRITGVDIEGSLTNPTIFYDNNLTQKDLAVTDVPQMAMYSIITESGTVVADGVLARLEIDTTGFTGDQSWSLALGATLGGPTDFDSISADITDGSIHIPEPASLALLSLGGLAVVARRKKSPGRMRRRIHRAGT